MTTEQTKQYEICKTRRHEEATVDRAQQSYQGQLQQAALRWKTCRWCGTQYQEVAEVRQVERS